METAKLFKNGRSQAVRLPKKYSLPGEEVYIKQVNGVVMLIPKDVDPWKPLVDSLDKFSDDFFDFSRDPGVLEKRNRMK
jgi:antitoxin VapB